MVSVIRDYRNKVAQDSLAKLHEKFPLVVMDPAFGLDTPYVTMEGIVRTKKPRLKRNRDAHTFVSGCRPFKGSNMWAEWVCRTNWEQRAEEEITGCLYVVYSYRHSWPLLVYELSTDAWFANSSRVSQSTSRHMNNCRPEQLSRAITYLDVDAMSGIEQHGFVGYMARRIDRA